MKITLTENMAISEWYKFLVNGIYDDRKNDRNYLDDLYLEAIAAVKYLEELEDDIEEDIEFDPIAFYCDFNIVIIDIDKDIYNIEELKDYSEDTKNEMITYIHKDNFKNKKAVILRHL